MMSDDRASEVNKKSFLSVGVVLITTNSQEK